MRLEFERLIPLHQSSLMIALSLAAAKDWPVMPARTVAMSSAVVVGCALARVQAGCSTTRRRP